VYGTHVLLEAARRAGITRFVHVSTDEVYGSCDEDRKCEMSATNPTRAKKKVIGEDELVCSLNTHVFVPRGAKHRMQNTSDTDDLVFVEVQVGNILQEEDIIRYEDDYSRVPSA
jgi:dTDP-4-dehydrorhamnose reductase